MPASSDKTFIDWSHKVLEELVTLNARLESLDEKYELLRSGMEERTGHIDRKLEKINEILLGGSDPSKSLLIRMDRVEQKDVENLDLRVDRLEQSEGRRTWLLRASIVACLGCIGALVATWIKAWH